LLGFDQVHEIVLLDEMRQRNRAILGRQFSSPRQGVDARPDVTAKLQVPRKPRHDVIDERASSAKLQIRIQDRAVFRKTENRAADPARRLPAEEIVVRRQRFYENEIQVGPGSKSSRKAF